MDCPAANRGSNRWPHHFLSRLGEIRRGKPFRHIDDLISQDELRLRSDEYQRIAGFSVDASTTWATVALSVDLVS